MYVLPFRTSLFSIVQYSILIFKNYFIFKMYPIPGHGVVTQSLDALIQNFHS